MSCGLKHTGVFAADEETERIRVLAAEAATTPVIAMSVAEGIAGRDWATQAWDRVRKEGHAIALTHDLPDPPGYYGMTRDGEFVVAE